MGETGGTFQVPEEMREMLDKGVAQARAGFEKVMKAAGQAANEVEQKAGTAQAQARDLHQRTLTYTEQNVAAAFDLAERLVKAKSLDEVMKLQNDYLTRQFATLRGQIQEAGEAVQATTKAATGEFVAASQKIQQNAKAAVDESISAMKETASAAAKAAKAPPRGRKS